MQKINSSFERIKDSLLRCKEIGALISFAVVFAFLSLLIPGRFLTFKSIESLCVVVARTGLIAIAMSLLLISKEIDLSIGSIYAFTMCLVGWLIINAGIAAPVAFLIALAIATLLGLINGIITTRIPLPSFITTLGCMMVWRGLALGIFQATPMAYSGSSLAVELAGGRFFGRTFNLSIFWLLLAAIILWLLLEKTDYGNWVYATGDKEEAARALGVNTNRVKITNFAILAFLTGLSAIVEFSRLGIALATEGVGLELEVIAAAILGGTSLFGGYGTIWGAILGALLIAEITVGVILAGISAYWYRSIIGATIILAVTINRKLIRKL